MKIVYGPYADEYTRSLNALAITIGTDIFFRNGAYRPETEEGRKILAHELTYVAQSKEYKPDDNRTREELERINRLRRQKDYDEAGNVITAFPKK